METNYKERYETAIQSYQEKLKEYEDMVNDDRYWEIVENMPLSFLGANQLCEKLKLFHSLEKKPLMSFSSLEEAKVLYKQLTGFKAKTSELLEGASYLAEVGNKAKDINDFVEQSPYLGEALKISVNDTVIDLAKKCLREVPNYSSLCTRAVKWNFIESALASLSKKEVGYFIKSKIILSKDLDHISLTRTGGNYQENLLFAFEQTGHGKPVIKAVPVKLKGVTFDSKDGVPRQKLLEELKNFLEANPKETVNLEVEHYIYTPEIGDPEPAIRVLWEGKDIGNLGKDVVKELETKYQSPSCTIALNELTGGGKVSYGCEATLTIYAPNLVKEEDAELSKEN